MSAFNDIEILKSIENLKNSCLGLRYDEADRDEIRALLERTRNLIKKRFGEQSNHLQQLQQVRFIYPRASQKNVLPYFKKDKQIVLNILNSVVDDLKASSPALVAQLQQNFTENPFFVSYTRSDEQYALQVINQMNSWGYATWRDKESLKPADVWLEEIHEALKSCASLLLILTPQSLQSAWVAYEWTFAFALEKPIVQLKFEDIGSQWRHPILSLRQEIDFTQSSNASPWQQLETYLKSKLAE